MVKKKTTRTSSSSSSSSTKKSYSVEQLLDKGMSCMEKCQPEMAEKFFMRALEMEPNSTDVMDVLGEVLVELGQADRAKELFIKSIALSPNVATTYMNLGQLLSGNEAIASFRKGIELMLAEKATLPKKKCAEINEQLSSAYCNLTEMYLTDACFEEDAEQQCDTALQEALKCTPRSVDVYYLIASVRISQQRREEAQQALTHAYSLWQDAANKDPNLTPHYQLRFNIGKLFVELEQYQTAIDILETLIDEQDFIGEVWHSLGLAYQGAGDLHSTCEALKNALRLYKQAPDGDPEIVESLTTLIAKVENNLPELDENEDMETDQKDDDEDED